MLASIPASCRVVASILPVRPLPGFAVGAGYAEAGAEMGIAGYHCLEFFRGRAVRMGWMALYTRVAGTLSAELSM